MAYENLNEPPTGQVQEHQIRRPGWKSSEFWITAIVAASPILLPLIDRYVGTLPENSPYAIIGAGIVAAGYAFSRGQVKASRNLASGTQTQVAHSITNEAPKAESEGDLQHPLAPSALNSGFAYDAEIYEENENIEVIRDTNPQA